MKKGIVQTAIILIYLAFLLTESATVEAQIKVTTLDSKKVPKGIQYSGEIKEAFQFNDKDGIHIVIITETGSYINKKFKHNENGTDAEVFAYHYIIRPESVDQVWKVYDVVKDCPFDIEASFIKNAFQITDLNNDGIAEIWLMYKTVCRSDVSPHDLKIIMYVGHQKFAMRGHSRIRVSEKDYMGGEYKFDTTFLKGPATFREFAKKLWSKHVNQ